MVYTAMGLTCLVTAFPQIGNALDRTQRDSQKIEIRTESSKSLEYFITH
jgi:hypothetical protein